jgi:hypothetical protein
LTKVGKVMMPFHTKTYISFMLNQEEDFSDSVRHAKGGTVVLVRSTDQRVACSSPTQHNYFVCNYCFAGARPLDNIGAAAKFDNTGYNFSYTFNQDGSKSLNLGVNANIPIETPWVYLEINMGLGFSMNSYSGSTLSTHGGLCVGYATACGGIETGGSLYWDRGGSFMGATVYAGVYASFGEGMARVSAGYEAGLFGMEGRGLYAGASAGGLYAQYAQNGGWNYGGALSTEILNYDSENGLDYIGKEFVDALLADDDIDYPEKGDDLQKKGKWGNTNYCGAGGQGGLTDGVDGGCFAHDYRYEKKHAAGVIHAFTNISPTIVSADVKLVINSFANIVENPLAGIEVGVVFSIIGIYKMPLMLLNDLIRHTSFDNKYGVGSK